MYEEQFESYRKYSTRSQTDSLESLSSIQYILRIELKWTASVSGLFGRKGSILSQKIRDSEVIIKAPKLHKLVDVFICFMK